MATDQAEVFYMILRK